MTPALVIFDCDGVLVDSEPITNRLIAQDLTRRGLPLTTDQSVDLFVGGTIKGVFVEARRRGADLPDNWVENMYDVMHKALADEVEIISGMRDVLDRLDHAAVPYCVASNGPMSKMRVTLGRTGLWDRLQGRLFSAHDVGIAKPDPGLFLHAASRFDTPPERCVVIEDSASGAQAAQSAGMPCFGFTRDTPAAKLTAHGAVAFETPDMLPSLLGLDG